MIKFWVHYNLIIMKNSFFFFRNLIIGLIMILGKSLSAQEDIELYKMLHPMIAIPGYIITNAGDSIFGKMKYTKKADGYMSQIMMIKPNKEKIRYDAVDVLVLAAETELPDVFGNPLNSPLDSLLDYFECKPSPKKGIMVFMYKYEEGRIKVYHNPRSGQFKSTWTRSSPKITGISFTYSIDGGLEIGPSFKTTTYIKTWYASHYIEKNGGEFLKIDKKNYETLWPSLFEDCPEILEEVNLNPDLKKFKNFLLIVRIYNDL